MIVLPLVSATPACKYGLAGLPVAMALTKAYLGRGTRSASRLRARRNATRGHAALRLRPRGLLITVLDAGFTLTVFTPILLDLSVEVTPPMAMGAFRDSWLFGMAFTCSLVGLLGAAILGQKLVGLEIANQKVEALLRKDLVLLETTPAVIVGTRPSSDDRHAAFLPQTYFRNTLESLRKNYFALFKHFGILNFWLSLFDQVMVIAPYAIAAPLVFAANSDRRITLGTLIKMSNSFEKVFASLSVIAENWGVTNDFRSTFRRLREFETKLYPLVNVHGGDGRDWRRSCCNNSSGGASSSSTQLTEVVARGETVHEVLASSCRRRSATTAAKTRSRRRPGAVAERWRPQYEMRV